MVREMRTVRIIMRVVGSADHKMVFTGSLAMFAAIRRA
jgi:hypothetical protein